MTLGRALVVAMVLHALGAALASAAERGGVPRVQWHSFKGSTPFV